ncbi:recombinase family protein [Amycolatopsis sp. OK19-0408]|uniref:Recombinase family protein n=1 Tax=Amycolatopsis iheyensis TaxID=2945988 RepID=A0A9X2NBF1_9PSEU|nr:recombinase family protein [Amycolatopsis iheyensis]MCR6484007.1 recombinase family protein [Amycolatopsis iheyensis]
MTSSAEHDPWAALDALWGRGTAKPVDATVDATAFYGRCSTEDNQDPQTSRGWQLGNARRFIEPRGGTIVAEYFDVGESRSVPWHRRPAAAQLLLDLKDRGRGWTAVVVGEGTRCWFGNQFSLTAPRLAAYGVDLWVPELGGRYEARNPSHAMLMSLLGGMSESERRHVQLRVRAAMDAQVRNEGRHQGGRAPYGYVVVDGGVHPHPRKAAEGLHLRVLQLDPEAAVVVARIFAEYLESHTDREIASALNRDGIPCPSARCPAQNRHRPCDGWQASTVRAILENPRYTGYAVFGRWTKHDVLLDPDDVAAGHAVRFRRAAPGDAVRSERPAHPGIVSVADFTQVQLLRRAKARGGSMIERAARRTVHQYRFRGLIRCALCGRKMESSINGGRIYYRCRARTLPTRARPADHPATVYLREDAVVQRVGPWIAANQLAGAAGLPGSGQREATAGAADAYRALGLGLQFDPNSATLTGVIASQSVGRVEPAAATRRTWTNVP